MLEQVMMLASGVLSLLLAWEMWQRFNWFRVLVKSILTYGLGALAICSVIAFVLIPFFPGWNILLLILGYMHIMPVVVLIAVIVGCHKISSRGKRHLIQH